MQVIALKLPLDPGLLSRQPALLKSKLFNQIASTNQALKVALRPARNDFKSSEDFCEHMKESHTAEIRACKLCCTICDLYCHDLMTFQSHLEGRAHAKLEAVCLQMRNLVVMKKHVNTASSCFDAVNSTSLSSETERSRGRPTV